MTTVGCLSTKLRQRFTGRNHHGHGNGNGAHGDDDVIDHCDSRDHGIYGKYRVKNQDLSNHAPKRRVFFLAVGNGKLVMPFEAFVQLGGGFVEQEDTAREHNHVFAGTSNPLMWNSGRVRVMMCAMKPSMMMRITTASPKPVMRARSRWAGLTLFAKMATKTRLSIPKTTSSTRSVAKAYPKYAALPTN